MKKGLAIAGICLALTLLSLLVMASCVTPTPPVSTELEAQLASLKAEKEALTKQNQLLKDIAGPLPASLDNYYPPKAPAPVFLLEMFGLESMAGIMVNLQAGDTAGAKADFEAFKAQYTKLAGMVPEWKELFPMAPVDALGQALASGDPAKIGPAMGQVGQVCGSCHLINMTKVQAKYHWPDFSNIKVTDPVTKEAVVWREYMERMSGAWSAVGIDLQRGRLDSARKNFQDFSDRFKALPTNGCVQCHATPRTYFVDPSMQAMVDQLGKAVAATPPNAQAIEELNGAIGMESCLKCHWVHFPQQDTKARWKVFADLFK